MSILVLPILYYIPGADAGSVENFIDAWHLIFSSGWTTAVFVAYVASVTAFNYLSLVVANQLSTIHRTLLDSCRTVVVWIWGLITFYAGFPIFGEGNAPF
jgi:hypothetical protein